MMIQKLKNIKMWKEKPLYISIAIFMTIVLALLIRLAMPNAEYEYEGYYLFENDSYTNSTVVLEGIHLSPGIYRVELEYTTDTDLVGWCSVQDGTVFEGALLCNGEHLYSELQNTSFEMWLYETTDNLQIIMSKSVNGSLQTGNVRIVETNQLWTMLLTVVTIVALIVLAVMVFYYYNEKYRVSKEVKNTFFFVTLIIFIASLPYLCGYNITGADLTYHLQRIEGVKDGLLTGQFPVRIEPRWLYNHGYADAIFYCNTLLFIPAIFRLLGFTITASYNIYCIGLNIATAWISYYCFGKIFKNRNIGLVCSALYTLSIFRIYKLLITSAVGEGSAVTFMPLVIYGLYRIFTEEQEKPEYRTCWVPLMLGYTGLIQTHVLSCEITAIVTIVFCILHVRKFLSSKVWMEFVKAATCTVMLCLWYLVPFLDYYLTQDVHIKHVSGRTIQESGLTLAHLAFHFWRDGSNTPSAGMGMQYSHPVGIGLVLIVALCLYLIMWFGGIFEKNKTERVAFTQKTALVGILLLCMSTNMFPWDKIQSMNSIFASLVSSLQFPNRFLGWGTVCLVLIFGFCLYYFQLHDKKAYWVMIAVMFVGITTSSMYLLDYVKANQDYFELYNEESMGFGYISGAEYLIEGTNYENLSFAKVQANAGVKILNYEKTGLEAELQCLNLWDEENYVDVPILLYKGYRAVDAQSGQELLLCAGDNNVIRVIIPPNYNGTVQICFVSPIYWRIGEVVTEFTIVLLLVIWRNFYLKKEQLQGEK